MTKRRGDVLHHDYGGHSKTFALLNPKGLLVAVIDARTIDDAWTIGTGWGDVDDIEQSKRQGWKVLPCVVEWEE